MSRRRDQGLSIAPGGEGREGYAGNAQGAADGFAVARTAGTFGGLDDIASALENYASGLQQQEYQAEGFRVAEAESAFQLDLATRLSELDATAESYNADVQRVVGELTTSHLEKAGVKNDTRRMQLQEGLSRQGTAALIRSVAIRQEALKARALQSWEEQTNIALNRMVASPGDWDALKADVLARLAPALDAVPELERQEAVQKFLNQSVVATAYGLADAKNFAGARSFLDQNAGSINPNTVINLRQQIDGLERHHENEQKAAAAAARAAAREAALAAEDAAERTALLEGTTDASTLPDGFFAGGQNADLARDLRAIALGRAHLTKAEARARSEAITRFQAGHKLSPTESDVVFDALFKRTYQAARADGQEEQAAFGDAFLQTARMMLRQTSQVPPAVVAKVASLSRSTDATELAQAAMIDVALRKAAPWAASLDTGMSDRGKAVVALARDRAGGADPGPFEIEAAAAELAAVPADDIVKRQKLAADAFPGSYLKDFADLAGITDDPAAARDFDEERRRLFAQGVAPDAAARMAADKIANGFATTLVGGEERRVRGPVPEQTFPAEITRALGPEWVARKVEKDVRERLSAVGVAAERFALLPDDVTRREAREGRNPSWPVMVPDANRPGVLVPVFLVDGDKTTLLRWSAPADATQAWADPDVAAELEKRRRAVEEAAAQPEVRYNKAGKIIVRPGITAHKAEVEAAGDAAKAEAREDAALPSLAIGAP